MVTPGWHNLGGCQYQLLTTGTIQITGAVTLVGFMNLSATAQTNTVQAFDSANGTGQALTPPVTLSTPGNGPYVIPLGGIAPKTGNVSVTASGALTTGVLVLYQKTSVGPSGD